MSYNKYFANIGRILSSSRLHGFCGRFVSAFHLLKTTMQKDGNQPTIFSKYIAVLLPAVKNSRRAIWCSGLM